MAPAFVVCTLSACAAHSPMIIKNTTDTVLVSQTRYPPHHDRVFVTEQSLPSTVAFDVVATVEVGKIWYGSSDKVLVSMADRARELGANAVIECEPASRTDQDPASKVDQLEMLYLTETT